MDGSDGGVRVGGMEESGWLCKFIVVVGVMKVYGGVSMSCCSCVVDIY